MIQPVSLLPFSAAVLSGVLAVIAAARPLRPTRTARWFLLLNLCAFMWTTAVFVQLNWGTYADPALAPMNTWEHGIAWMIGIGVGGTTTYLFLFAAVAAGRSYWATPRGIAIAHLPFLYTVVAGITNPLHHLFLVSTPTGAPTGGPLAWPHYLSTLALGIGAAWLLMSGGLALRTVEGRRQAWMIGASFAVTIGAVLVFAVGPLAGRIPPINPVPVLFPVLSAMLGYQVLYHGLGDIVPLPTLAAIMDHAEMPLAYLDHEFRFVSVNTAFERLSRHTEWELIGRGYFELFEDEERRANFYRASETRETVEVREDTGLFPRRPQEPEAYWDWTLSPVIGAGREPRGFVLSLNDVSEAVYERHLSDRLSELDDTIHSSLTSVDRLVEPVREAAEAIGADSSSLMTVRDGHPWLMPSCAGDCRWESFIEEDYPHLAYAFRARDVLNTTDPSADDRLNPYVVKALGLRSVLALPLMHGGQVFGAVAFESRAQPTVFADVQVDFAKRFASSLALALDNARRYESERNVAQTLQESMLSLPTQLPAVEYANAYHSATEASRVGGDLYDLFTLEDGRVAMLMGDVSGHGLEAAVLTSLIKNTVRAHAYENASPSRVMEKTNNIFERQTDHETFATAFFAVLSPDSSTLRYCSGGHPLTMIVRTDGRVEPLAVGSPLIGILGDVDFVEAEQMLLPGDLLVMYTDGVTEARRDGELFGEERLVEVLSALGGKPPESIVSAVFDAVVEFARGELSDDIALLVVRLTPVRLAGKDEPVLAAVTRADDHRVRPAQ